MAEGLLRHEAGDLFEVSSAGMKPTQVRPEAIAVMNEIGIDISGHRSKSVDEFTGQEFDYVITVCDNANESCPVFPGNTVMPMVSGYSRRRGCTIASATKSSRCPADEISRPIWPGPDCGIGRLRHYTKHPDGPVMIAMAEFQIFTLRKRGGGSFPERLNDGKVRQSLLGMRLNQSVVKNN
jgi:protein-tyrosine-phosphatase